MRLLCNITMDDAVETLLHIKIAGAVWTTDKLENSSSDFSLILSSPVHRFSRFDCFKFNFLFSTRCFIASFIYNHSIENLQNKDKNTSDSCFWEKQNKSYRFLSITSSFYLLQVKHFNLIFVWFNLVKKKKKIKVKDIIQSKWHANNDK